MNTQKHLYGEDLDICMVKYINRWDMPEEVA